MLTISIHEIKLYTPCPIGLEKASAEVLKEDETIHSQIELKRFVTKLGITSTLFLIKCFPENKNLWYEFKKEILETCFPEVKVEGEGEYVKRLWQAYGRFSEVSTRSQFYLDISKIFEAEDATRSYFYFYKFILEAFNEKLITEEQVKEMFLATIEKS